MPMLDVSRNRLDYGRLLIPPEGLALQYAIATTYSVDLDTLLSIPVALYYAQTLEGELQAKDLQLIRAIEQTAKRLTVYHQKGQVKVPRAARSIYAYFEDSLVPIDPGDAFVAFHPKTWVLRYENAEAPEKVTFRFLVLSRNLTFDRSWDVACFLDGQPATHRQAHNEPLVAFLTWLHQHDASRVPPGFLEELSRADFAVPDDFEDFAFHPFGIPGWKGNPVRTRQAPRLLCLSPFLDREALSELRQNVDEAPVLLSRRVELECLPPAVLETFDCFCLSDDVVDGERRTTTDDGQGEPREQDLHAKVFLFDDGDHTTWFLGSANATTAAFERNVEFLLELDGRKPTTRLAKVRKELLDDSQGNNLFVPFEPDHAGKQDEHEQQLRRELRCLEYALVRAEKAAAVAISPNGQTYDLRVSIDLRQASPGNRFKVYVRPLVNGIQELLLRLGELNQLDFLSISETSLTRFLHFAITDGAETHRDFLLRIDIEGLPQSRLASVFKSIINSRDKFFAYLRLLLSDEVTKDDIFAEPPDKNGSKTDNAAWDLDMPIFEQLLVTASRHPTRLSDLDRVITTLREAGGDSVIPQDFLTLWAVFSSALPQVERPRE
jgi:hypothetical protein